MILLLGLLPSNTFDLTRASVAFEPTSCTNKHHRQHLDTSKGEGDGNKKRKTHLADLLLSLSERERLRLREEVTEQDPVM